ncbi:putative sterol carrier protein [Thiovulum sp. ES]|nr:putative sterol carrier protein [Thiovulum sp. ES]
MTFLSPEWCDAYVEAWKNNEELKKGLKKFTGNFVYRISDKEEVAPLQVNVEKGEITYHGTLNGDKIEFDMWAPFDGWRQVVQGELSVKKAMMAKGFGFKGSKIKAAMYMGSFERSINMMGTIETEF